MSAPADQPGPVFTCATHWMRRDPDGSRVWVCAICGARRPFNTDGHGRDYDELDARIRSLEAERLRPMSPSPGVRRTESPGEVEG